MIDKETFADGIARVQREEQERVDRVNSYQRFVFSTGRSIGTSSGHASLDYDLRLVEGYDGTPWIESKERPDSESPLTTIERRELADMMISRWQRWAAEGVFPPQSEEG